MRRALDEMVKRYDDIPDEFFRTDSPAAVKQPRDFRKASDELTWLHVSDFHWEAQRVARDHGPDVSPGAVEPRLFELERTDGSRPDRLDGCFNNLAPAVRSGLRKLLTGGDLSIGHGPGARSMGHPDRRKLLFLR